jgi:UDP-glucose 4-epimerase
VAGTLVLLEALREESQRRQRHLLQLHLRHLRHAAAEHIPIRETTPQQPINPYGAQQVDDRALLADFGAAYGCSRVICATSTPPAPTRTATSARTTTRRPT